MQFSQLYNKIKGLFKKNKDLNKEKITLYKNKQDKKRPILKEIKSKIINFFSSKYNIIKETITKTKLVLFIKGKLTKPLLFIAIYGLLINYVTWQFFGLPFNLLTFWAYGISWYFFKTELLDYLFTYLVKIASLRK